MVPVREGLNISNFFQDLSMSQRVNVTCYACVFFESPCIKLKFKAVSVQATKEHGGSERRYSSTSS
jgi:hypothetical protein